MSNRDVIGVALLGFGTVGQGVYDLLIRNAETLFKRKAGTSVVVKKILVKTREKSREVSAPQSLFTDSIDDILADPDIDIVVEVMGGVEPASHWIIAAFRAGKHVVTANKALLAENGDAILDAAQTARKNLFFEAAVAGGIPLIRTIRDGLAANRITGFYGIINGTCNYILSEMAAKGSEFADVLREAQALGYAEQDPSFDIDGIDAAHKLVILIRLCFGLRTQIANLTIEGISSLDRLDLDFARHFGYAVRLLAIATADASDSLSIEARVQPVLIPQGKILSKVEGAYNAAYIQTDAAGDIMLYGRGAGRYPTASAVVSDILSLAGRLCRGGDCYEPPYGYRSEAIATATVRPADEHIGTYYLRFNVRDEPHVLEALTKTLAEHGVSIASLYQPPSFSRQTAAIAVLTHETRQRDLWLALKKIDSFPFLVEKSRRIPIEPLTFS